MFKNIYVKKLWSLNPDEYKYINLDEAIEKYKIYCTGNLHPKAYGGNNFERKSFQEWLETEI